MCKRQYSAKHKLLRAAVLSILGMLPLSSVLADETDTLCPDAKLVLKVATGGQNDSAAVAALTGGSDNGDFVSWQTTVAGYDTSSDWWTSFPADVDVQFVFTEAGAFYACATGDEQSVLSVLTDGGISTAATWDHPMEPDEKLYSPYLNQGARSTVLAQMVYSEYKKLVEGGAIINGGPELVYSLRSTSYYALLEFEDLPHTLVNKMDAPIRILTTVLYMAQSNTRLSNGSPYDGTMAINWPYWPISNALNQKWNPKPTDTTDGSGTRSVSIDVAGGSAVFLTCRADGDNSNSGNVQLDGTVVSSFRNSDRSSHAYREGGIRPTEIALALNNNWSSSRAYCSVAVLGGDITFDNVTESPTGGMSDNPEPLTLTLEPGWNGDEEAPVGACAPAVYSATNATITSDLVAMELYNPMTDALFGPKVMLLRGLYLQILPGFEDFTVQGTPEYVEVIDAAENCHPTYSALNRALHYPNIKILLVSPLPGGEVVEAEAAATCVQADFAESVTQQLVFRLAGGSEMTCPE